MIIKQINIINYKNHKKLKLNFEKNVVCFVGLNGVGKTNVLDAIHFSCVGKSYFSSVDKHCINENESFFRLETDFVDNKVIATLEKGKRKKIVLNDLPLKKLSEYMGKFPVVVIAPDDNILILGSSEERRKFINQTLAQTNTKYFEALSIYSKILLQRNALLKNSESHNLDINLIEVYNEKLIPIGNYIYESRRVFITGLVKHFNKSYKYISNNKEKLSIEYSSALSKSSFRDLLKSSLAKDKILKRTTEGVHKDDLFFVMNDSKIKTYGSQGQQKTFLLALKLAQYYYIQEKLNMPCLFLIDDIFDKLDAERSKNLIKFVSENLNQVFISHTNKDIINKKLKGVDFQLIELE